MIFLSTTQSQDSIKWLMIGHKPQLVRSQLTDSPQWRPILNQAGGHSEHVACGPQWPTDLHHRGCETSSGFPLIVSDVMFCSVWAWLKWRRYPPSSNRLFRLRSSGGELKHWFILAEVTHAGFNPEMDTVAGGRWRDCIDIDSHMQRERAAVLIDTYQSVNQHSWTAACPSNLQ